MQMTTEQLTFAKDLAPEQIVNGEFAGDDNDFSCLVSRVARALANQGFAEAAADLTLKLSPEGFAHGTREEFVAHFAR